MRLKVRPVNTDKRLLKLGARRRLPAEAGIMTFVDRHRDSIAQVLDRSRASGRALHECVLFIFDPADPKVGPLVTALGQDPDVLQGTAPAPGKTTWLFGVLRRDEAARAVAKVDERLINMIRGCRAPRGQVVLAFLLDRSVALFSIAAVTNAASAV